DWYQSSWSKSKAIGPEFSGKDEDYPKWSEIFLLFACDSLCKDLLFRHPSENEFNTLPSRTKILNKTPSRFWASTSSGESRLAVEMWKDLAEEFRPNNSEFHTALEGKWEALQMKKNESFIQFYDRVMLVANEMAKVDYHKPEEAIIVKLWLGIKFFHPYEFINISNVKNSKDIRSLFKSWDNASKMDKFYDDSKKKDDKPDLALATGSGSGHKCSGANCKHSNHLSNQIKNKNVDNSSSNKSAGLSNKTEKYCIFCKKDNHNILDCYKLQRNMKSKESANLT
ncbi:hypothetical protein HK096_001987, partial [Nowakowskiella sp. JEL0078]